MYLKSCLLIFSLEPTIYNSSYFGDGDGAIIYSNFGCQGFEGSISDCSKQQYGSFSCSRNNVVGIKCQDSKWPIVYYYNMFKWISKQLVWMVMFVSLVVALFQKELYKSVMCNCIYVWISTCMIVELINILLYNRLTQTYIYIYIL